MSKVKILLIGAEEESDIQQKLNKWGYKTLGNISVDDPLLKKLDTLLPHLILICNLSENDCYKIEKLKNDLKKYNIPLLFLSPNLSRNSLKKLESLDNYYYLEFMDENTIKFAIKTIIRKSKMELKSSVRLKEINKVLSRLTSDPEVNIRNITILCGKLLNAHSALYRSIQGDQIYTLAHWNLPPDFRKVENAEGHLCFDLIKSNEDEIFMVNNLTETDYYESDPNVKAFNLKTYAGYPVKFAGKTMGLLCVVYQEDYLLDEDEKELLKILASTIGEEEERKITISNLKQSDELFRSLWEKNLDATLILDWNGEILFANPAAAKLGGIKSPEDAIGHNILDYVDEQTQKRIIKHINLVKQDKGGFLAEYKIKTSSGENKFVEGLGTKIIFRGKPANIVTVRDVTPRKKAERRIKKSESFYKSIFENTGTATLLVDENNIISLVNSEFEKLFPIKSQFDYETDLNNDNLNKFLAFLSNTVEENDISHFTKDAIKEIIKYSCRLNGNNKRFSLKLGEIKNLLIDSFNISQKNGTSPYITSKDIKDTIKFREKMFSFHKKKLFNAIKEKKIDIRIEGSEIGQINGLTVLDTGDFTFGHPVKITAKSYRSSSEKIINIHRDIDLSGKIYKKSSLIIENYFKHKFSSFIETGFGVSLNFEQVYSIIEGDSATIAETLALMSSIANIPLKQNIAITGSMNQNGEVLPVGGIIEKIEGFYDACKNLNFTGDQGVIIPSKNIDNIVLKDEINEDIQNGKFHIWAIDNIDEGIELMTDYKAGTPNENGEYEEGTFYYYVSENLKKLSKEEKKEKDEKDNK
ncbi:MAG: Peptidase S16 lon domain protein [Petrotoga mobilis]|nr:MAG: Peptidase S16 lon domain protein [Petrotoga mobilis]